MRQKEKYLPGESACPCDSGDVYAACCGRWHADFAGGSLAPSPLALMRSRYCAYVLGRADYLMATWHPATAPTELQLPPVKWLGLEVLNWESTDDAGVVEFVARCREGGRATRLQETSRFVRETGKWFYIDGDVQDGG
jgi:SEC-C motif-containing protein